MQHSINGFFATFLISCHVQLQHLVISATTSNFSANHQPLYHLHTTADTLVYWTVSMTTRYEGTRTSSRSVFWCNIFILFSALTLLVGRQEGIWPVKNWMLVRWWWWFDWSFARLIAPVVTTTSIILSSSKIRNGDTLVPANPGPPGKLPLKRSIYFLQLLVLGTILLFHVAAAPMSEECGRRLVSWKFPW